MKKSLLSLAFAALAAVGAMAADVTLPVATGEFWNVTEPAKSSGVDLNDTTIVRDGVTLNVAKGTASYMRLWNASGTLQWRTYNGSTFTISTAEGVITKIVATGLASAAKTEVGTYTSSTSTWTGSAESVTFTCTGTSKTTTLVVTVGEATGVVAPVISGTTPFYGSTEVSMSCETEGASIYYTTDGTDPTANSTLYSAPFTITEACTVKAVAIKDGASSAVESKDFAVVTGVATVAEYKALADNTAFVFTGKVVATGQSGNYLYAQDETGGMYIFGATGQTYSMGKVIPAGWAGTKVTYSGAIEATTLSNFAASTEEATVTPVEISISDLANHMFEYVVVKDATVNTTLKKVIVGTDSLTYYDRFKATFPTDLTVTYDVYGVASYYAGNQLLPISFVATETPDEPTVTTVATLAEYAALADDTEFTFTGEIVATGQNGKYLYAQDETGGILIYGSVGQTYTMGDVIPANWTGKKVTYNGAPELTNPANFQASTTTAEVTAVEVAPTAVSTQLFKYVVISNATIDSENSKIVTTENGEVAYYNRFKVTLPEDLTKEYDVYAIASYYSGDQVLPISFVESASSAINDINVENARVYKTIENGQVIIVKGDARYNIMGQPVK